MQISEQKPFEQQPFALKLGLSESAAAAVGWGFMPLLSLTSALGLLLVVLAYSFSRNGSTLGTMLYWCGMLTLFVPVATRLITPSASRKERIALVVLLGMTLLLVKALYSPSQPRFHDELQQMRTAIQTMETGRLFQENPMLPVSPSYPGLHNITVGLSQVSGLTLVQSGIFVNAASRLIVLLSTYLFYEFASKSPRVAGIAAMLYMTNPHFVFFSAMFAYQSVALALALLLLYLATQEQNSRSRSGFQVVILLGLVAVTITHHASSYMLLLFFGLWIILLRVFRSAQRGPLWMVIALTALIVIWVTFFAPVTLEYLIPQIQRALDSFINAFTRANTAETVRPPANPLVEQIFTYSAALILAAAIPIGVWIIWTQLHKHTLALIMGIGALGYFGTLALRIFSAQGTEIAGRSMPFVYFPAVFALAITIVGLWSPQKLLLPAQRGPKRLLFWSINWLSNLPSGAKFLTCVMIATVMFVGGITAGWPPHYARLPGPYLVTAYERSIEPQGIEAARWAEQHLGHNHRIALDFNNYALMGMYGMQYPVFSVPEVYFSRRFGPREEMALRQAAIRYLLVDRRLTTGLPLRGAYFVPWEPNANRHTSPINPALLNKFNNVPGLHRLFDSGDIIIYDVRAVSHVP